MEKALWDQPFAPQSFIKASKNINKDFDPLTDVRGSADYRRKAAQNLVVKYGYELTGSFVPNLADRNQVENLVKLNERYRWISKRRHSSQGYST